MATGEYRPARNGATQAVDDLIPIVYQELRRIARAHLRRERRGHTLNTTALVHEAYVELARFDQELWRDKTHFLSIAARMMRRVLIDYAVGASPATVKRDWNVARAWLNRELAPE